MDAATAICLIAGLVLVTVEIFQAGNYVFGIMGGLLLAAGIVLRVLDAAEGEQPLAMFFIMVVLVMVYVVVMFLLMVVTARHSWLTRVPAKTGAGGGKGIGKSSAKEDYSGLINTLGVAVTMLRPAGNAEINGKIYSVMAEGFFINCGEVIRVISIEGKNIVVKKAG